MYYSVRGFYLFINDIKITSSKIYLLELYMYTIFQYVIEGKKVVPFFLKDYKVANWFAIYSKWFYSLYSKIYLQAYIFSENNSVLDSWLSLNPPIGSCMMSWFKPNINISLISSVRMCHESWDISTEVILLLLDWAK